MRGRFPIGFVDTILKLHPFQRCNPSGHGATAEGAFTGRQSENFEGPVQTMCRGRSSATSSSAGGPLRNWQARAGTPMALEGRISCGHFRNGCGGASSAAEAMPVRLQRRCAALPMKVPLTCRSLRRSRPEQLPSSMRRRQSLVGDALFRKILHDALYQKIELGTAAIERYPHRPLPGPAMRCR